MRSCTGFLFTFNIFKCSSRVVPACPYANAKQQSEERIPSTTLLWAQLQDLVAAPEQKIGKRCKQETQRWKCHGESLDCKYLEASVSTCTYSDNSISNQPKNIKEQYLRYQAAQMEHIETWSWMYWWEETPLLKSTAQASDANWSEKGLLATAASTISWEWETGNKLQKCPGRLQPKSSA